MKKNIIFLGSSVTYGDDGWSMCEYIRETTSYNVIKWAVSGTTLLDKDENSYVSRLDKMIDTQNSCDCFICQLSTNDASMDLKLGEISSAKNIDKFDTKTVFGAIEYIVFTAMQKWNCPILFYTNVYMENEKYQKMVDGLILLKEKWKFDIIDLWNDESMRNISKSDYEKYMKDCIHPNRLGYSEWWGEKFVYKIKSVVLY